MTGQVADPAGQKPAADLWVPPVVAGAVEESVSPAPRAKRSSVPPPPRSGTGEDDDFRLPSRRGRWFATAAVGLVVGGTVLSVLRDRESENDEIAPPQASTPSAVEEPALEPLPAGTAPPEPSPSPPTSREADRGEPSSRALVPAVQEERSGEPAEPSEAKHERVEARERRSAPKAPKTRSPAPAVSLAPPRGNASSSPLRSPIAPPPGSGPTATPSPKASAAVMGDADAHYDLASEYMRQRKVALAIEELKQAVAANPRDAKSYRLLGMAYNLTGAEKSAVEAFEKFLQLDPGYKDAGKIKATVLEYRKKHPR